MLWDVTYELDRLRTKETDGHASREHPFVTSSFEYAFNQYYQSSFLERTQNKELPQEWTRPGARRDDSLNPLTTDDSRGATLILYFEASVRKTKMRFISLLNSQTKGCPFTFSLFESCVLLFWMPLNHDSI